jgi:hypothetical protein
MTFKPSTSSTHPGHSVQHVAEEAFDASRHLAIGQPKALSTKALEEFGYSAPNAESTSFGMSSAFQLATPEGLEALRRPLCDKRIPKKCYYSDHAPMVVRELAAESKFISDFFTSKELT